MPAAIRCTYGGSLSGPPVSRPNLNAMEPHMFKKTLIALAVAMAAAPAMAAIDRESTGNGELFLAVSNFNELSAGKRVTYTFDTGIKLDNFLPSGPLPSALSSPITLPGWNSFLSELAAAKASIADVRFQLIALDGTFTETPDFTDTADSRRVLTTSNRPAAELSEEGPFSPSLQNSDLQRITAAARNLDRFLDYTNRLGTHATAENGWSVNRYSGPTDDADYFNSFVFKLDQDIEINFDPTAPINEQIGFVYAGSSVTVPGQQWSNDPANLLDYQGKFSLLENGTLTYSVAAIPEPGEWAFMMAGLSLAGMVARRRSARRA
jgi:hypothetical protein